MGSARLLNSDVVQYHSVLGLDHSFPGSGVFGVGQYSTP